MTNVTDVTLHRLRQLFASYSPEHRPSPAQWKSLQSLVACLTRIAEGKAQEKYYVSSIDPGVGKTTAIRVWLECLLQDRSFDDVGVVVFFDRLDQIREFIESAGLDPHHYAVRVSQRKGPGSELNTQLNEAGLGCKNVDEARILLTTKEQLRRRFRNQERFEDMHQFYFRGRARRARIWDESFMPGSSILIPKTRLGTLLEFLRSEPELVAIVEDMMVHLREYNDREVFTVPQITMTLGQWMTFFKDADLSVQEDAETLFHMSGRSVTVRIGQYGEQILVDTIRVIPLDLKPCLITDASARVRATYTAQETERGDLLRLPSAAKHYGNLWVHYWPYGSGKNAYLKDETFNRIVKETVHVILSRPSEKFLIITHKPTGPVKDFYQAVMRNLPPDYNELIQPLYWGSHTASNKYGDISNVIVSGMLHYSPAQYEGIGRSASLRHTEDSPFSREEEKLVKDGEFKHNILQSVGRSTARLCVDGACPPTNVWIVAAKKTGIQDMLKDVFPGCTVAPWELVEKPVLKGKTLAVFNHLQNRLAEGVLKVSFSEIRDACQFTYNTDVQRATWNRDDFRTLCQEDLGFVMVGEGRNREFVHQSLLEVDDYEDF